MLRQEPSGGSSLASAAEGPKLELRFFFFFPFPWPRQPLLMLRGFIINCFCDCNCFGLWSYHTVILRVFQANGHSRNIDKTRTDVRSWPVTPIITRGCWGTQLARALLSAPKCPFWSCDLSERTSICSSWWHDLSCVSLFLFLPSFSSSKISFSHQF